MDFEIIETTTGIFAEALMFDPECSIRVGDAVRAVAMARIAAEAAAGARVAELEAENAALQEMLHGRVAQEQEAAKAFGQEVRDRILRGVRSTGDRFRL